ncbi:restriction endonuclease subunit S [Paenibacillus soyae]|uniref:Restriction endonuclease subunit S n=1 Tax=Paenibacillus soyae TaxID=2969249 RepID=A0A9X2MWN2_9BACL|nr:restriction endonuclease subunit S [Paenibacillus soyae]MCR2807722.1 restriction endonuclease subunit S [Paenibacillus soyae]
MSSEWKITKLEDVSVNLNNKRIPLSSRDREKLDKIYPYYGAQGIIDYVDNYLFDGEYLLIAEDGENLKSRKQNVANIAKGKFWVNNHAHILQNNSMSDLYFLYYLINNEDIGGYITGSVQPKLSKASLNSIKITLPALSEQRAISKLLKSLDDKIELNNAINKNLEEMAQALFKRWFVDFEFPNENGEPYKSSGGVFEESELGLIPIGWKADNIGNCSSVVTRGIAPKYDDSSEKRVINQKCIRNGFLNISLSRGHSGKVPADKQLQFGDILVNSTGVGTLGRVAQVIDDLVDYTVDSHVTIIRPNNEKVIGYMGCLLKRMQSVFEHSSTGSTGQTELGREAIKQIKILIPEDKVMEKFSAIYDIFSENMSRSFLNNRTLAQIRDILLPKLMSGEIRVPVEQP